jgi:hypothetical protein
MGPAAQRAVNRFAERLVVIDPKDGSRPRGELRHAPESPRSWEPGTIAAVI